VRQLHTPQTSIMCLLQRCLQVKQLHTTATSIADCGCLYDKLAPLQRTTTPHSDQFSSY
jgi:hypothetical protein